MRVLITNENDRFDVLESNEKYVGQTGEVKSTFISAINKVKLLVVEFDDGYCSCWNWGMCKPVDVVDVQEPKRTAESTAIETLKNLGYKWNGGQLWKPPLGKMPNKFKPRVSVSYEKAEFKSKFWGAVKYMEETGESLFIESHGEYIEQMVAESAMKQIRKGVQLYRKIETEITPIQAAIDACKGIDVSGYITFEGFADSANSPSYSYGVINICRAIVNAFDGME